MITKKLQTTIRKILTLVLTLSLVFGANITLAQNYLTQPAGPPPGNNAPAPIHEGQTGQGKYWGNIPGYSLGSFLNIVEGLMSGWVTADDEGVAAKQFCLMYSDESLDYFPGNSQNTIQQGIDEGFLKCIDWSTGWGEGSSGGSTPNTSLVFDPATNTLSITDSAGTLTTDIPVGSGSGGGSGGSGSGLPNGQFNGNAMVWREDMGAWTSAPHFRQVSFTGNGFLSFVMGDWPDTIFSSIFGTSDASVGSSFGKFALNGPFYYRPDNSSDTTDPELQGGTPGKILAGHATENYRVDWRTPGDLGLATQQDITNLASTITNIADLPEADENGQFLWWNSDFEDFGAQGAWSLTTSIFATSNILTLIGGSLVVSTDSLLTFFENDSCPVGSDGSVTYAQQKPPTLFQDNLFVFDIKCSMAIKLKDVYGDEKEEVIVKSIPILEDEAFDNIQVRSLCYTFNGYEDIEQGTLVDCQSLSNGSLFLPGPKFQVSQWGSTTNTLTQNSPITPNETNLISDIVNLPNDTQSSGSYIYWWQVPVGLETVTLSACSGGGGGGGGGAAQPGDGVKPGGGGGGGGGAGNCVDDQQIDLTGVTHLKITVGSGGRRGFGGYLEAVTNSGDAPNVCVTCGANTNDGLPGAITKIEKFDGTDLEPVTELSGGIYGKGGKRYDESGNPDSGGFGGASAATPVNLNDYAVQETFISHNGQTGANATVETIENPLLEIGYITTFAEDATSRGGNGGAGLVAESFDLPASAVYPTWSNGSGGNGAHATSLSQGNGNNLRGGTGASGLWASGGGGGGGASGYDWMDTCAFPVAGGISFGCGGSNEGYDGVGGWYSQAGPGGHGGPGFVKLTW